MTTNENIQVQPIEIAEGTMNTRGQVIIPAAIRKFIEHLFGESKKLDIEIQLLKSGIIQLVPTAKLRLSSFMEYDPELVESATRAYAETGPESFASDETVKELFK